MEFAILILSLLSFRGWYKTDIFSDPKSRPNKLGVRGSLIFFSSALIFLMYYVKSQFNVNKYLESTESLEAFSRILVIFFIAYLISDSWYGYHEYNDTMLSLDGYIHHFVYIIVCLGILYTKNTRIAALVLSIELPTFVLCLGKIIEEKRNDFLFGITFLIFRIIMCGILAAGLEGYQRAIMGAILSVHAWWFYNWIKKYYFVAEKNKNKST